MRIHSSVTSLSWIPSEAITGMTRLPIDAGVGHYDDPPPDRIEDLEALRAADRFRFANELAAWVDVVDGRITGAGYTGGGRIGATTLKFGVGEITVPAVAFADIQAEPVIEDGAATFTQTAGGRTGAPLPRRVSRPPFVKITAPTAWTTLSLTIGADGSSSFEVIGASPFPRHWIYDHERRLAAKSGSIDFKRWAKENFGDNTPWGDSESPALVTKVESALERELSLQIMRGGRKPKLRKVQEGARLTTQGDRSTEMYLLLDGVLSVEVDGDAVAEVGPGTLLGERAVLEGGLRTATLRALTPARVAVADAADIDIEAMRDLAKDRRREEDRAQT